MLTYACVYLRYLDTLAQCGARGTPTYADVCVRMLTYAYVC